MIQISWFAMAALVDLSTVATYAIGGLPLNVLGSTDLGDQKILKSHAELDMSKFLESTDSSSPFKARYSTNYKVGNDIIAINLSQCKTKH
ncbi:hypothetical protein KKH82_00625 [Patescibacteria group bacterium]|nr:hypothetical protein [Patescibacteria group bacterium]